MDWYDYGARFYDSQLARFHSVDRKTEEFSCQGPYVYAANNPIRFIDKNGEGPEDIIIFIFASKNTESGAGHASVAIGQNDNNLTYYSHYRDQDGGGQKVSHASLSSLSSDYEGNNFKHGQTSEPVLVIRIKTSCKTDVDAMKVADEDIKSSWTALSNNCADLVKDVVDEADISEGVAFGISTPNELVEDLFENNKEAVNDGTISVEKGNLENYLKNEQNSVNAVIFGKEDEEK